MFEKNSIKGLWKGPNYATAQFDRKMLKQNFIQYILYSRLVSKILSDSYTRRKVVTFWNSSENFSFLSCLIVELSWRIYLHVMLMF